jgi:hypothetical protein
MSRRDYTSAVVINWPSSLWPRARAQLARTAGILLSAAAIALAGAAPVQAQGKDHKPPRFEGLKSATTCIPGPIGPQTSSSYHLAWNAARDSVTPQAKIVYEVYQAMKAGGENFAQPTYTTAPGATSFNTPPLPASETFYFVGRARDRAGNEDSNTVERQGENLCV